MDFRSFSRFYFLTLLYTYAAGQTIDTPPSPVVGGVGETVTLTCRAPNAVAWTVQHLNDPSPREIYNSEYPNNGGIIDSDDVDKYEVATEGYDLSVMDLQVADGGIYGCKAKFAPTAETADLVVIESPNIDLPDVVEEEVAVLSCSLQYGSPDHNVITEGLIPQMHAYIEDAKVEGGTVTHTRGAGGNYYVLKYEANYTAISTDNDKNVTCEVRTDSPFSYSDNTIGQLNILFVVREIDYNPKNEFSYVGESITCSAKGNPPPTFKWQPITSNGPTPVEGPVLTFLENQLGTNQWKCFAQNTVKNIESIDVTTPEFEVLPAEITPAPGGPPPKTEPWVIAVATVVPLIVVGTIIALGLVFWRVKSKKAPTPKPRPPRTHLSTIQEEPQDDTVHGVDGGVEESDSQASDYYDRPNSRPLPNGSKRLPYGYGVPVFPVQPGTDRMTLPPPPVPVQQPPAEYPGRTSPGFADLGVSQLRGSMEGVNMMVSPNPQGEDIPVPKKRERKRPKNNNSHRKSDPYSVEYKPVSQNPPPNTDSVVLYSEVDVSKKKSGQKANADKHLTPTPYAQVNYQQPRWNHVMPSDSD